MRVERIAIQGTGHYKRLGFAESHGCPITTYADFLAFARQEGLCDDAPYVSLNNSQLFVTHYTGKPWLQVLPSDNLGDLPMQLAVRVDPTGTARVLTFMCL
jgi:hypothetical protein